jgi:glyoxylase-like metal-dependent hydrolase (beta-lactamase superfamily II)
MEARIDRVASAGANSWLVGDDAEVIVVDPGSDAAAVLAEAGDREILAVICTHGHATHVAAALAVAERDESLIALHPRDLMLWREVHGEDDPEIDMEDGGIFEVADATFEVIHSAGHSPGSVCLYSEDLGAALTGDAVLAAGPCVHDGSYPDFAAQINAIGEHILTLPPSTRLLPGHGGESMVKEAAKRFDSWVTGGPVAAGGAD